MTISRDRPVRGDRLKRGLDPGVATGEEGRRVAWDEVYVRPETAERMMRWALTHAPMVVPLTKCSGVLEVGTGTGMLSGYLAQAGVHVTTVDLSQRVLDVAGRFYNDLGVEVAKLQGDGTRLPCDADAFEAVFSQGLWEHFGDDYIQRFAVEALRVAPVVYASVPSAWYPRVGKRGPGLAGNERFMGRARWRRALGPLAERSLLRTYADWKLLTFGGVNVPYPNHLLIEIRR